MTLENVPKSHSSYLFGISAIYTTFHDVLFVLAVISLLGYLYTVKLDTLFITALLTIICYSINDTIVIFDRVRENLLRNKKSSLQKILDVSIRNTLRRSLSTSITLLLILFMFFIYGNTTVRNFVLAVIIGVSVSTYSSIFVAPSFFMYWKKLNFWRK